MWVVFNLSMREMYAPRALRNGALRPHYYYDDDYSEQLAVCQDYYGRCRMPGERFPYNMRGRVRSDCTCQTSGAAITYYCYS